MKEGIMEERKGRWKEGKKGWRKEGRKGGIQGMKERRTR